MADLYDTLVSSGLMTQEEADAARKNAASGTTTTKTPPKQGDYVRTYVSTNIPAESTLKATINKVFQEYYGRDANEYEIGNLLPEFQAKYKAKNGSTKSTVTETYKNGQLVNTQYLTADGEDPKNWLDTKLKEKVKAGEQNVNALNIPEGPSGKYFVALKNFASDKGLRLSDQAATA